MVYTKTTTITKTTARFDAIKQNVRLALISAGWNRQSVGLLVDEALREDRKWVQEFHSYITTSSEPEKWLYHFWIKLNWDDYGRLAIEQGTIEEDDRWEDGAEPTLIELAQNFYGLRKTVPEYILVNQFIYSNYMTDSDIQTARKILNSKPADSVSPHSKIGNGINAEIPDLPEFLFGLEYTKGD